MSVDFSQVHPNNIHASFSLNIHYYCTPNNYIMADDACFRQKMSLGRSVSNGSSSSVYTSALLPRQTKIECRSFILLTFRPDFSPVLFDDPLHNDESYPGSLKIIGTVQATE